MQEYYQDDPRLFWRQRASIDVEPNYWMDRTDALGLRNRETPGPKGDRLRVLCMGDSCTYGLGLPLADAWPARLGALAPEYEVVNGGVPAYSSYQGLELARELAPVLEPDVVVVSFGFNDARAWGSPKDGKWLCLTDRERLEHLRHRDWAQRSALVRVLISWVGVPAPEVVSGGSKRSLDLSARPRVPLDEFRANMAAILDLAPRGIVLIWPRRIEIEPTHREKFPMERYVDYQLAAAEVARERGAEVVDARALFHNSGLSGPVLFLDSVHATPAGTTMVAEAVSDALGRLPRVR